eukprot:3704120-Amphidinium_carterae.1
MWRKGSARLCCTPAHSLRGDGVRGDDDFQNPCHLNDLSPPTIGLWPLRYGRLNGARNTASTLAQERAKLTNCLLESPIYVSV